MIRSYTIVKEKLYVPETEEAQTSLHLYKHLLETAKACEVRS